jgi:predicted nucleotidyltransferase
MVDFISNESYRFLKTNPDLSDIIYLTLSGSHAYGTSLPNSDIDLRGVLIEQPKYIYGLQTFEQFEDLPTDTVIFGLKKFIKLCTNSNPNALELLGTDQSSIIKITEKGELLRNNSGLFLSKMAIQSFGNYATAQLRRLQNALCHDSYTESEKSKHLSDTLNLQLAHFRGTYTEFKNG